MSGYLSDLDAVLRSVDSIEKGVKDQPKVWAPSNQLQILSQGVGSSSSTSPFDIGPKLVSKTPEARTDLFLQSYIRPEDAKRDMTTAFNTARTEMKSAPVVSTATSPFTEQPQTQCHVFPPLLVRYADPKTNSDMYIPVDVYAGAELHYAKGVPDIIINFHADSHAITITACNLNPKKLEDYTLAIQTMYTMTTADPERMLSVPEFTTLYDMKRYELLRSLSMRMSFKK